MPFFLFLIATSLPCLFTPLYFCSQLDPLDDDFLHSDGASSLVPRRRSDPLTPEMAKLQASTSTNVGDGEAADHAGETENEEGGENGGQATPRMVPSSPSSPSSSLAREKTHLLGPPSPPPLPPLLSLAESPPESTTSTSTSILKKPKVLSWSVPAPVPVWKTAAWKTVLKSCILVAKVSPPAFPPNSLLNQTPSYPYPRLLSDTDTIF